MKRLLFIGHEAGRTGAPFVLLHLLRWIRENRQELEVDLLLLSDGELRSEYEKISRVRTISAPTLAGRINARLRSVLGSHKDAVWADHISSADFDLVIGNTVATLPHLSELRRRGCRTVCWLHELEGVIDLLYDRPAFLRLSKNVDLFVCASEAVTKMLERMGVSSRKTVLHEFVPTKTRSTQSEQNLRDRLDWPDDAFILAGGGTIEQRKGTDLFVEIASRVARVEELARFLWIGGSPHKDSRDVAQVESLTARLGIGAKVHFTGIVSDPEAYLASADVFALTSREDPFPLICLEAAALACPIICFADAGGMPEFVGSDCGFVVPGFDLDIFGERVLELARDEQLTRRLGGNARDRVSRCHDVESQASKFMSIIDHELGGKP